MNKVTILGCGRWASFHAWYQVEQLHNQVLMWGRAGDPVFEQIAKTGKNAYIEMPKSINYTADLRQALAFAETIMIVITAQAMREFAVKIKEHHPKNKVFILCMKGIDQNTGECLSQIMRKNIDASNKICVWVGPGHVQELTSGQPNMMIIAGDDAATVQKMVKRLQSPLITLLYSNDLVGVEISAAAKNVMGIAAGFLDGLGMSSLKGVLMARGCYEVSRLIEKMGGKRMTAFGMSHLGDFEATLFSKNSHNRRYGEEFIKGALSDNIGTAEGVATTQAMYDLAQKLGVFMPIVTTVYSVLYQNADRKSVVDGLLKLQSRQEFDYE